MKRMMRTMTLYAPYARMKLQTNPMRSSYVTNVDKVLWTVDDVFITNTEGSFLVQFH